MNNNVETKHLEKSLETSVAPDVLIPHATRNNFQLGRRFFHATMGILVASTYKAFLTHQQIVYILGTAACLLYFLEQIRINYPDLSKRFEILGRYLLRAEEQIKESAAIPYAMAILLTILTFPQTIAVGAIFTLAIADPLSAIIGIRFGKRKLVPNKSLEGSIAFLVATFCCLCYVLIEAEGDFTWQIGVAAFLVSFCCAVFEMFPLKVDDNLTIPLFTAFTLSIFSWFFELTIL